MTTYTVTYKTPEGMTIKDPCPTLQRARKAHGSCCCGGPGLVWCDAPRAGESCTDIHYSALSDDPDGVVDIDPNEDSPAALRLLQAEIDAGIPCR